jgi:TPR repeat protein
VEAYKWYCLAAAQGNSDATSNRDKLLQSLSPEQMAEAQRRAAEFGPGKGSPVAPGATPDSKAQAASEFETEFFQKCPDLHYHPVEAERHRWNLLVLNGIQRKWEVIDLSAILRFPKAGAMPRSGDACWKNGFCSNYGNDPPGAVSPVCDSLQWQLQGA